MKTYKLKIRGNKYNVDIKEITGNIAEVDVNGTSYNIEISGMETKSTEPIKVASAPKTTNTGGSSSKQIKAPLPGSIIKINYKEGDSFNTGDVLVVMEAMKMENNISAESDGVIKSIKVSVGDNILQDAIIIELN